MSSAVSNNVLDVHDVLITGAHGFVAQRMAGEILTRCSEARVILLCDEPRSEHAHAFVAALPEAQRARAEVILGEAQSIDLGMSGGDYRALVERVSSIHHMATLERVPRDSEAARALCVEGTRNLLEFASACPKLERVMHWSSTAVAGKRKGVVLEEELLPEPGFFDSHAEMLHAAETLVRRAHSRLPITVLRPSVIVGDSRTGVIDRFAGPYHLMVLIARNATPMHLPLPGPGEAPLHLVPVDYVTAAAHALSRDQRARGGCFHLVDPNPLSARRVYELVAEHAHTAQPRGSMPKGLARTLWRAPVVERLGRVPRAFVEAFDHPVFFNSRHAVALLDERGVRCPPFDSYAGNLLRPLLEALGSRPGALAADAGATSSAAASADDDQADDPFD
ncbi:SDR family oxidoreductase [Haliangium ochraceum]|uniref:Male sterility domain protein n=1 Tax=Haliangium ochraceum (strain DSM 14365 / JCM 11303 / SMP-2) TaxID=502025 RepID=D0LN83_HALO1|nr:SDR family oxidoreductase [Haliangium ochraceum]ACY15260.1 Male sterility domain protein [Haliangium ochraceum DSM 14365]